jgi:hypothetical protein
MIKKFFKKIGKKIKKLGKSLAKPFKKIFKNKFLGTIGMMLIAPMLMQGMGTFFRGVFNGQGMGQSFTKAVAKMGETRGGKLFNNISDGIKDMFSGGKTDPTKVDLTKTTETLSSDITKDITLGDKQKTLFDESFKDINKTLESSQELTNQALGTTEGKLGIVGEESASGKIYTGDNLGETIKIDKLNTNVELLKPANERQLQSLLDSRSADFMSKDGIALKENLGLDMELGDSLKDFNKVDMTEKVNKNRFADFWEGKKRLSDLQAIKPLENVEALPGFISQTTVGEGIALGKHIAMNKMPEPYQAPSVDVSGAFEALSQVDTSGIGLETIGTNVPSMSALAANGMNASLADKWMNMTKKYNYIYDTSFPTLAT